METADSGAEMAGLPGAIVLAGGLSTRMGSNKALLRPTPGGPTLIEIVVARVLEAGFAPPLLVTNSPGEYEFLGLYMVSDEVPGMGPLAGILAGLEHSPFPRSLVVACDMPLLNPALLRYLASLDGSRDAAVPRWTGPDGQPRLETLHAVYSRSCVPAIRRKLSSGSRSIYSILQELDVLYVEEDVLRRFDPDLLSFNNINAPSDLEGNLQQ